MDKIWSFIVKGLLVFADNMTGRLMPGIHEIASKPDPVDQIRNDVAAKTKFIPVIIGLVILGMLVYAIKSIINLITK